MAVNAPFKVIIVGGGVTGLALAHCLSKASISYIVLERGKIAPPYGNSITLQPNGLRILHQLGCLPALERISEPMGYYTARGSGGKAFMLERFWEIIAECAGYDPRTVNRQAFLHALYTELPDKSKVIEAAGVEEVVQTDSLVKVTLSDGREFQGDILVGADGVHSTIREIMWNNIEEKMPGTISAEERKTFATTYCAIVGLSKPIDGLERQQSVDTVSFAGTSFLYTHLGDQISYTMFIKLPPDQQYRSPNRVVFTAADLNAAAAKIANFPLNEHAKFKDLWEARIRAHMVSLEEGVLNRWFFGRIVLAGDAVHKTTPNAGQGGNVAIEDAASLANSIHDAIYARLDQNPSNSEIESALQKYRDSRIERVKKMVAENGYLTRLQAYDGWSPYLVFRWLAPRRGLADAAQSIARRCLGAPKLSYVSFEERKGSMPWRDSGTRKKAPHTLRARLVRVLRRQVFENSLIILAVILLCATWLLIYMLGLAVEWV